jgi:HK97 gp10 family phage protein
MSVDVKLSGFNMQALSEKMRGNISEEVNSAAESCASLARQLAPVDTGFMRDNIAVTEVSSKTGLHATVKSQADYSVFVEYGTVNQDPQPFMTPAFESARHQLNNGLLRALK